MIRYLTAGESHGPQLTGIVEGIPAGLPITEEEIALHLARRQKGYGRGGRMAFEKDRAEISSGVRFGKTTGAPIAMQMPNRAHEKDDSNWPKVLAKEGDGEDVEKITVPRPGHADLTGVQKYRYDDIRPAIERSSARETAMRVACSSIARKFLKHFGIEIGGHVTRIGSVGYENSWEDVREIVDPLAAQGAETIFEKSDESPVRCLDEELTQEMRELIIKRRKEGSSLGGHWEVVVTGLPEGLGSFVHWDRKLGGQIAQAVMGTQAMKGVEIGQGFESGRRHGQVVHDEIMYADDTYKRKSNRMGGLEGGVTTGMPLIIRGVMKPIPTMLTPIDTVDIETKENKDTRYERSDVCALPRAIVVMESVIAPVLANAFLEKFGGDSIEEIEERYQNRNN
ncbi:chorismate synthase [Aliifodinibius salipaludis]|uniref:Chorismate synthase n=1 Tax=Fodinibius salipaludis TaxID=2032627 RepID=A0A2A2GE78_9BACT|nr:chorismate synthase [Aliifodinibius salipaludis]PAU95165.1 chorismate synthase [Aliifodinibius salipaludis]